MTDENDFEMSRAAEDDRVSLGQRRINMAWEITQALVVLIITGTGMFTSAQLAMRNDPTAITAFLLISNAVFLVIGFYFGRTNHQRVGGIGGEKVSGR